MPGCLAASCCQLQPASQPAQRASSADHRPRQLAQTQTHVTAPRPPATPLAQGNRTPHTDALSRGAITGLTLAHGRGHVFRALLESICFGTEQIFEAMRAAGYCPESVTVAGGATRSDLWLQARRRWPGGAGAACSRKGGRCPQLWPWLWLAAGARWRGGNGRHAGDAHWVSLPPAQIHADVSNVPFVLTKVHKGRAAQSRCRPSNGAPALSCCCCCSRSAPSCPALPCCPPAAPVIQAPPSRAPSPGPGVQVADAPALGCAILAAVAAGLYPDVRTACLHMVHQVRRACGR